MKVELQAGDTITIPDGCKATIKDNQIAIEEQKEFKDGDIVISEYSKRVLIFSSYEKHDKGLFINYFDGVNDPDSGWFTSSFRLATEEEKQLLFDKMEEQGLKWNAEEKRVEKVRWRAEDGKSYYYVGNQGILMVDTEDGHIADKNRYEFSNYFRTSEQAEEAAKRVKEVLHKFHEEIGE